MTEYARKELSILQGLSTEDNKIAIENMIPEILSLIEKFHNEGFSGEATFYMANVLADTVKCLCLGQPISPITGDDSEWTEIKEGLYQNKRCADVFKENGTPYYLSAVIWFENNNYFTGEITLTNGVTFRSKQQIREFPFTPKSFIVPLVKLDDGYELRNVGELPEAQEYYLFPRS